MDLGLPKNVREALAKQPVAGPHPEADVLNAYAERSLSSAEDLQTAAHLATCAACREVIFLAGSAIEMPEPVVTEREPRPAVSWWRWAVPVTALLGLSAAFMFMYGPAKQTPQEARVIAQQVTENYSARDSKDAPAKSAAATNESLAGKDKEEKKALNVRPDAKSAKQRPESKPAAPPPSPVASAPQHADAQARGGALANNNLQNANGPVGGPSQRANQAIGPVQATNSVASDVVSVQSDSTTEVQPSPYKVNMSRSKSLQKSAAGMAFSAPSTIPADQPSRRPNAFTRMATQLWRITPEGHIERFVQNQWHRALNTVQSAFHVVASVENHVWAGGKGPDLYHSSDGGENWDTIQVKTADGALNGTMRSIHADDANHVSIVTDSGETWTTADGGQTWAKQQ